MATFRGLTATITLSFQLLLTGFGALTACVDQPHRHGGVAAPDCVMHHQGSPSPDAPAATTGHHHHGASHEVAATQASTHPSHAPSDTPSISCRCSSDPMSFLVADNATMPACAISEVASPDVVLVPLQSTSPAILSFARTSIDFTIAPALPPPRLFPV